MNRFFKIQRNKETEILPDKSKSPSKMDDILSEEDIQERKERVLKFAVPSNLFDQNETEVQK